MPALGPPEPHWTRTRDASPGTRDRCACTGCPGFKFFTALLAYAGVKIGLAGPPRRKWNTKSVRVLVSWKRHAPLPVFHVADDELANRNLIGAVLAGSSVAP